MGGRREKIKANDFYGNKGRAIVLKYGGGPDFLGNTGAEMQALK
jgi:hypothetical protein